jgi:predicted ATPase
MEAAMAALPSLPIRGRDAQLAVIDERLEQARDGIGSVVVIEGGPGLGKTRLLQAAWVTAERMAFRAGRGMADPIDSVVELAPLMEALFGADPPMVDRSALSDVHAMPEQRFWLLRDIEALLDQAALDHPLLICLDDMQWADSGTAAALRQLPRRLANRPIAWLVTTRPGQGSPQLVASLAELVDAGADQLRLGPLQQDAVAQVAADILQAEPDAELRRRAERVRGNPFLLVEFLGDSTRNAWSQSPTVGPRWSLTVSRVGSATRCATGCRGCRSGPSGSPRPRPRSVGASPLKTWPPSAGYLCRSYCHRLDR